jgi:voltage-gated potassium channel
MYKSLRAKTHAILDPEEESSFAEKFTDYFIIVLIILNVIAVILETVDSVYRGNESVFKMFEIFSVTVFTIEYILRIWTCTIKEKYKHPFWGRIRFMFSLGALIDLAAILPFYLPLVFALDLRSLRILRLLRVFKMGRYTKASRLIVNVIKSKKEELVLSFFITFFLIIAASTIMYFVENAAQPNQFSSIPAAMWWSVTTLTTVGYGDTVPITPLGKLLTGFISLLGIGVFALPAGILASGFSDEFNKEHKKDYCPHCGQEL